MLRFRNIDNFSFKYVKHKRGNGYPKKKIDPENSHKLE